MLFRILTHHRRHGFLPRAIYQVSLLLFFWALYDGVISYLTPLIISAREYSLFLVGLVISFSSLIGAAIDLLLGVFLKQVNYKVLYFWLLLLSLSYLLILFFSRDLASLLFLMLIWGLYYNLQAFANYDFVSRDPSSLHHSTSFGLITLFKSLGYLIAPVVAGVAWLGSRYTPFLLAFVFVFLAWVCFFSLPRPHNPPPKTPTMRFDLRLWQQLTKLLFPVLVMVLVQNVFDSFFWTIGPLYAEKITDSSMFSGILLTLYSLPILFTGWVVAPLNR